MTGFQKFLDLNEPPRGNPRYYVGQSLREHSREFVKSKQSAGDKEILKRWLFDQLILSLETNSKHWIKNFRIWQNIRSPSIKIKVSSPYYKWEETLTLPNPTLNPLNKFFDSAFIMIWLRESVTKEKRNEESGSPCLRPPEAGKNL